MRIRTTRRERAGLAPSEHTEAVRFMRMVQLHEPRYPALRWLHAIPNGGWRHATVAAKLKGEGVRPGVHDYCWPFRASGCSGLYLELKAGAGRASKEQRAFGDFVVSQGFRAVYVTGWQAAWRAVCDYAGIPYNVA